METVALLLSVSVLIAAWLYTVKKLSTMSVILRHSLGLIVGAVAMFVAVLILFFIGVIAPKGKSVQISGEQAKSQSTLLETVKPEALSFEG